MKRLFTPKGYKKVVEELERLKSLRTIIAEEIEEARSHGDLSENGEYDAAREKSGMNEAKIRDLEGRLSNYEIIDPTKLKEIEKVVFGVTVELEDMDSGESRKISIYGDEDSLPDEGIVSYNTPIAKALFGKEEGDIVKMKLPGGEKEYEIMAISNDYKG